MHSWQPYMPACHSVGGVYIGIILYLMIYCKHGKRILIQNWYAKLVARIFTSLWFCTSPALCLIVKLCFWPHISEWKSHRCERLVSWHNFAFISFIWPKSDHRLALSVTKLLSLSRLMTLAGFVSLLYFQLRSTTILDLYLLWNLDLTVGGTRQKFWGALLRTFAVWNPDSGSSSSQSCPILEEHL